MALYGLSETPFTTTHHHQERCYIPGRWKWLSQSSSSFHTTKKQLEHHSKPDRTTVGMMSMQKRNLTCSPPSQFGYRPLMVVKGVKELPNPKLRHTNHIGVHTPQGEYRKNRLHPKIATVPSTDWVSTSTTGTITSTTVQPTSVPLYAKEIPTKPQCPIKELPDNNKGNSNVSAECAPEPLGMKVVKTAKQLKSRNLEGHPDHTCYINAAGINSHHWYNKLICYLKQSRTETLQTNWSIIPTYN